MSELHKIYCDGPSCERNTEFKSGIWGYGWYETTQLEKKDLHYKLHFHKWECLQEYVATQSEGKVK